MNEMFYQQFDILHKKTACKLKPFQVQGFQE